MPATRTTIAIFLLITWVTGSFIALWWFQSRDLRPFDLQAAEQIETDRLSRVLKQLIHEQYPGQPEFSGMTLVNFWQPGCSCNRFNRAHVRELAEKYSDDLRLVTVVRPQPGMSEAALTQMAQQEFGTLPVFDRDNRLQGLARIPAAPAAALLNSQGDLSYFGPYSDSQFCGIGGTDFVSRVTELLRQGEDPALLNTMVFGCFCSWGQPQA